MLESRLFKPRLLTMAPVNMAMSSCRRTAGGGGGGGTDPNFSNVVALLHFDGADGSTTMTDVKGHTFTAIGNAQLDTSQSKFGGSSLLLDGTGDWIESLDNVDWEFGSGDWTIEGWFRSSNLTIKDGMFSKGVDNGPISWDVTTANNTGFFWYYNIGAGDVLGNITVGSLIVQDAWFHAALERFTTGINLYIGGVGTGVAVVGASSMADNTGPFRIGKSGSWAGTPFTGWVDEFRVTKGFARYKGNFTPPTAPFPNS